MLKTRHSSRPTTIDPTMKGLAVFQLLALLGVGLLMACAEQDVSDQVPQAKAGPEARAEAPSDAGGHAKPDSGQDHDQASAGDDAGTDGANGTQNAKDTKDTARPTPPTQESRAASDPRTALQLTLKRLVLASAIEEREPVELAEARVQEPVFAFVEMSNLGESQGTIHVLFEHESGTQVGFVDLEVPADSPRYRTWARTRNIRKAGRWTAIVTADGGDELARESFVVGPPEST